MMRDNHLMSGLALGYSILYKVHALMVLTIVVGWGKLMPVILDAMKISEEEPYRSLILLWNLRPKCRQNNIDIAKSNHHIIAVPYVRHDFQLPGRTVLGKVKAIVELVIARSEEHMLIMVGSPLEEK